MVLERKWDGNLRREKEIHIYILSAQFVLSVATIRLK